MDIKIDIETLPDQREGARDEFIKTAEENFHAPSTMNKDMLLKGLADKGIDPGKALVPELKARWADAYRSEMAEPEGDKAYRDTSFGDDGCICVVCVKTEYHHVTMLEDSEGDLLEGVFADIRKLCNQRKPFFIGHNVSWDLERLFHKAVMLGIDPGFKLPFDGRHGSDYFCTMQAWAGFKKTISQDNLCKRLGIAGKGDMDGSKVWDTWQEDPVKVATYCIEDVLTVEKLHKRLTFAGL